MGDVWAMAQQKPPESEAEKKCQAVTGGHSGTT
jgi:hypothetical protein